MVNKLQQIKQQMLAGKFKDAEALEKAYLELQSKLGEPDEEEPEACGSKKRQEEEEEPELADGLEWAKNGELSQETMASLSYRVQEELIQAYR